MGTRSLANAKLNISLSAEIRNTMDDGTAASVRMSGSISQTIADGVGAEQANRGWQIREYYLSSGASVVFDVYDFVGINAGAGDGNDLLGQAMSPIHEIVAFMVRNENAVGVAGTLEIEPDATNGWTPVGTHTAANGGGLQGLGVLLKAQMSNDGFPVTDGANHRVKFTANGGNIEFSVYVLGRSDTDESSSSSSSISSPSSNSSSSSSSNSSSSSLSSSSSFSSSSSSVSSSPSSLSSMSSSSVSTSSSSASTSSESSSSFSSHSSSSSSVSTSSSSSSSSSFSSSSFSS